MRRIKQFILMLVCFVLTACTANKPEIRDSDLSEVDFVFRSSAAPVIEKMSNTQEPQNVRKVVKYDELRAVWLSYIDLAPMLTGKSEQEFTASFEAACRNISSLGCNTVFVHLRPFGDAMYRSDLYPVSRYITGRAGAETSFDPLEIMVKTAHSHKLSIHGWINPLRLESEDCFSGYDERFLIKKWYDSKNGYVCSVQGDKHLWLNPGYSEVRQLIADGAAEIAQKYDVDGIHYDDYFYPTTEESFDKNCFETNRSDKALSVWRLDNISDMVSRIYKAVKSVDKELVVGVSPQGNIDNNYRYMYADVKKWGSEKGYVDYICPQIYFGYKNPVKPFASTLKEWENVVIQPDIALYIGLAVYKIEGSEQEFVQQNGIIAQQIDDVCCSQSCKGFALYAYNNLFSDSARAKSERERIYKRICEARDK